MRFHTAVTTLMFAGALAATPQLAAAAGCLGYNDVKTTHAEAAENGGNTEITLDGSCYNLVSIVYLGQQNGTMVQVPAGNVQNNGSNQIIVTTNGLLAPGDYRIELWYNTFGGGAPTTNGSAFLTVAGAPAGGGGGPLVFMARTMGRVDDGDTRYFVPSGASLVVNLGDHDHPITFGDNEDEAEMRIPVACTATGLSAWAVNTRDFPMEAGDSIKVSLLINGSNSTINCTIDQNSSGDSCGPSTAEVALAANDKVVIKVENNTNREDAEIVANWTCAPTPPDPS